MQFSWSQGFNLTCFLPGTPEKTTLKRSVRTIVFDNLPKQIFHTCKIKARAVWWRCQRDGREESFLPSHAFSVVPTKNHILWLCAHFKYISFQASSHQNGFSGDRNGKCSLCLLFSNDLTYYFHLYYWLLLFITWCCNVFGSLLPPSSECCWWQRDTSFISW